MRFLFRLFLFGMKLEPEIVDTLAEIPKDITSAAKSNSFDVTSISFWSWVWLRAGGTLSGCRVVYDRAATLFLRLYYLLGLIGIVSKTMGCDTVSLRLTWFSFSSLPLDLDYFTVLTCFFIFLIDFSAVCNVDRLDVFFCLYLLGLLSAVSGVLGLYSVS